MSNGYCCYCEAVLVPHADRRTLNGMNAQRIALVTGANKGIGFALAGGLGALRWTVGVGARDAIRGEEAADRLRQGGADAFMVPLDVTDDESVTAAAQQVSDRFGRLDTLVNNAGVAGPWPDAPSALQVKDVQRVLDTNVVGVIRVTNAFLPLLRRSEHPRVVNQSSHVASLTLQSAPDADFGGPSGAYAPSKSFVTALTIQYARELADTNVLVNASCPGYVATDLNAFNGTQSPEDGAEVAIRLATLPDDGPRGLVFDADGPVPW